MKINTSLILCAGFGKRLNPLTLKIPKPLIKLNNLTMLENCINLNIKLGIKKVFLNTFYLSEQIYDFIKSKNFEIDIQVISDGKKILDTGGGIKNMTNYFQDNDFLVFNPDTLWTDNYIEEINKLEKFYFLNKSINTLLVVRKELSFDQNLKGDFELEKNLLKKNDKKNLIYIGCQILNKNLFKNINKNNFSISEVWNELLKKRELNGYESFNKFYHLTNFEIFKKLKDL